MLHCTLSEVKSLSRVRLFVIPWTVAYQAPPSMGFSRQEYWSGLPFPSPGDLPDPGIESGCPALQANALTSEPPSLQISVSQAVFLGRHKLLKLTQEKVEKLKKKKRSYTKGTLTVVLMKWWFLKRPPVKMISCWTPPSIGAQMLKWFPCLHGQALGSNVPSLNPSLPFISCTLMDELKSLNLSFHGNSTKEVVLVRQKDPGELFGGASL